MLLLTVVRPSPAKRVGYNHDDIFGIRKPVEELLRNGEKPGTKFFGCDDEIHAHLNVHAADISRTRLNLYESYRNWSYGRPGKSRIGLHATRKLEIATHNHS